VSLALMALIAASATVHVPSLAARSHPTVTTPAPHDTSTSNVTSTTTAVTLPRASAVQPIAAHSSSSTSSTQPGASASTGPTPTTTTTSTVPVVIVGGSGSGSAPESASASTQTEHGYLQSPDDTSVIYAFSASGPTLVAAQWSTDTTLSLTVVCPSGTQSADGASSVQLTLANPHGSCQATLSEPTNEDATLTYSMTIGPWNGT
jgi:hypothetical protein